MPRPRLIEDAEVKDARVRIGASLWDKLNRMVNRGEASSVSALIRKATEEKYGDRKR